jgi:hypothetical protein
LGLDPIQTELFATEEVGQDLQDFAGLADGFANRVQEEAEV